MHGKHLGAPKMLPMQCKKHILIYFCKTSNVILLFIAVKLLCVQKLAILRWRCDKKQSSMLLTMHGKHFHVMKTLLMHCNKHCVKIQCASHNAWEAFSWRENASHALREAQPKHFYNTSDEIFTFGALDGLLWREFLIFR